MADINFTTPLLAADDPLKVQNLGTDTPTPLSQEAIDAVVIMISRAAFSLQAMQKLAAEAGNSVDLDLLSVCVDSMTHHSINLLDKCCEQLGATWAQVGSIDDVIQESPV
jgi:hypothetical protein